MHASICAIPFPIRLHLRAPIAVEPSSACASPAAPLPTPTRAKLDFPATASPPVKALAGKENLLPAEEERAWEGQHDAD